jgi:bifunctional non-homologous end joining protein LigD
VAPAPKFRRGGPRKRPRAKLSRTDSGPLRNWRLCKQHDTVCVFASHQSGHERFPLIVSGALNLRQKHFVIDGWVVVLDKGGVSDFDALHSRKHDKRAQFYAFDMLAGGGDNLRTLPLALHKGALAQLLSREVDGIFIAEYEQGDIGNVLFRVACNMGLEGIVSKHLDRAYGAGRCKYRIKIKPAHPAFSRVRDKLSATPP